MHTFQKKDKTVLTMNPFDKIGKQWMLITSGDEDKTNTMTASWGGVGVLWGSDVVYIFVRQSRYTKEFIDKTGHFSISFLGEEYRKALQHLGTVSGRDGDKISEAGVSVAYENGIPYIDEAELVLTCTALSATDITMDQMLDAEIEPKWYADGDLHTMYVGKIEEILVR